MHASCCTRARTARNTLAKQGIEKRPGAGITDTMMIVFASMVSGVETVRQRRVKQRKCEQR